MIATNVASRCEPPTAVGPSCPSRLHPALAASALMIALIPLATGGAQARHDVIRGRVTADSGKVLPSADVMITRVADRQFKSTRTDDDGRYGVDWPDGTGDYLVRISATGF